MPGCENIRLYDREAKETEEKKVEVLAPPPRRRRLSREFLSLFFPSFLSGGRAGAGRPLPRNLKASTKGKGGGGRGISDPSLPSFSEEKKEEELHLAQKYKKVDRNGEGRRRKENRRRRKIGQEEKGEGGEKEWCSAVSPSLPDPKEVLEGVAQEFANSPSLITIRHFSALTQCRIIANSKEVPGENY